MRPNRHMTAIILGLAILGGGLARLEAANDDPLQRNPANPLFEHGAAGTPDALAIGPRAILRESPSTWKMWYAAVAADGTISLGLATSSDGLKWKRSATAPALAPAEAVVPTTVIKDGAGYRMWYHTASTDGRTIGSATSRDGLAWTPAKENPALQPGLAGAWDAGAIAEPRVVKVGGNYLMFYVHAAGAGGIGLATSKDAKTWAKSGTGPVLNVGSTGSWDERITASGDVAYDGKRLHLWYLGGATANSPLSLGYASSADGLVWNKSPNNPVLGTSSGKGDEAGAISAANVLRINNVWWIYYGGLRSGQDATVCLATTKADAPGAAAPTGPVVTRAKIMEVMKVSCVRCHKKACASYDDLMKSRWVVAGKPANSTLFTCLNVNKKPGGTYHNVKDDVKELIRAFILQVKPDGSGVQ